MSPSMQKATASEALFINPRMVRFLEWAWICAWVALGNAIIVQPMPPELPFIFVGRPGGSA